MTTIRIATRQSKLALWQAEHAAALLADRFDGVSTELVPLSTRGDEVQDRPLSEIGGKGLFLKELERALLDGRADIAVHSMKDVPAELADGFALPAILARGNAFDAFVSNHHPGFDELPRGARLGTSSLRRQCLARALRPDLNVSPLRGNVNTRLAKLDRGDFDAILLAAAGLERLGLADRLRQSLGSADWVPAPGQGAVGIECRSDDLQLAERLAGLQHAETATCVQAERAVTWRLEGSCQVPIGAHARLADGQLHLRAVVGWPDGTGLIRGERTGPAEQAEALGDDLGRELLARGGGEILRTLEANAGDG